MDHPRALRKNRNEKDRPTVSVGKFANWVSAFATVWQNGEIPLEKAGKTQKY